MTEIWGLDSVLCVQLCPTLCDPVNCSLPGSSALGIFQARKLEWVAISFFRGSSQPKDWTHAFCISRQILYHWATREALSASSSSSSVAQSCLTLWPHGLQYTRLLCPSPTPRAYSNSCPLSQWYHPTISSSVVPFSSPLQLFPASGSFQMSQFFTLSGQSIGVSASASVLPMNIQDWFPLGWTGLILQSKSLLQNHSKKASILQRSTFFIVHSHIHTWLLEKP